MKKVIFSIFAMMLTIGVMAADKPVIFVDYFYASSSIDSIYEDIEDEVRNHVLSGLMKFGHIQVQDVDAQYALNKESQRRSSEAAMADETARVGEMRQLGANYLIEGQVSSVTTEYHPGDGSTDPYYTAKLVYTLKLINCADGTVVDSKTYTHGAGLAELASGSTPKAAVADIYKYIEPAMKVFVKKNFKLDGTIVDSDYTINKDKMVDCYITLGSESGIQEKMKLEVSVPKVVAGQVTYNVVGELSVVEVVSGTLSKCKVTKGQKELAAAMENYLKIKADDKENAHPIKVLTKEANEAAEKTGAFFKGLFQ